MGEVLFIDLLSKTSELTQTHFQLLEFLLSLFQVIFLVLFDIVYLIERCFFAY